MKGTIIFVLLCLSLRALAQERAVLLISLKGKTGLLRQDIAEKVLGQFKKGYHHSLPLTVIRDATQEDLFRETRNPDNKALFWISHANSFSVNEGLGQDDLIVDSEGNNVKDLFTTIHPNMNLLAVMGCKALPILNKNSYSPDLRVVSFEKKISSKKAIAQSLQALNEVAFREGKCERAKGIKLNITRTRQRAANPVSIKVLNRGKLVGFFPKSSDELEQQITVYLPEALNPTDLKLIFDSGRIDNQKAYELGDFSIQAESTGNWSAFKDASGKALGVTQNIYRYKGTIPNTTEEYDPFHCR